MQQTPFDYPSAARFRTPPPPKRSPARLVTIIALLLVILAALGMGGFYLLHNKFNRAAITPTPTPTLIGALYLADLTSNPGNWDCSPPASCVFSKDGYHIKASQKDALSQSLLLKQTFDDMVIEVKGIIAQGDARDAGLAIVFRVPQDNMAEGYGLVMYDDGTYDVLKWDTQGNYSNLVESASSSAIHQQLKQANDLKIVISGTKFTFYANGQQLINTTDSAYPSGYIGLAAAGPGTEAIFSHLAITKLPATA